MGKYRFRLQKLLDIRIDKEEESKREFQQAKRESLNVKEKLDLLKANYEKYNNMSNFKSVIEQKITHKYLKALVYSIDKAKIELKDKEKVVEMKRNELRKRQIDRKTVDIIKEKQETAFIKEQNRIEQKANDEFALYGFIRNVQNT
ncbi:flagellar export protein FliJ [Clostridium ljungdahlii]|uniref:Flagellar FliJ protein n=1 Tax=Clostridium ljungdahlii (strain ATCC 55383 / DSM 13528 / PETC) TaxID=748727 RepID=D8GQH1_CLOLD|nr:flagellar export protein FliJ [Clostridium ljungdahlii]ADK14094.1 flagellar biosynthesis chaperone FliJ [Clostridium ljungdahlii DSM 13528]OAA86228.1 flagellar biosynthesis chaperone [Clostridium ljungdahlii DSM 13528]